MAPNIPEVRYPTPERQEQSFRGPRYAACWIESDGLYYCGCEHETIAAAIACLNPDGRSFIRAWDKGVLRSLNDEELDVFIFELVSRTLREAR